MDGKAGACARDPGEARDQELERKRLHLRVLFEAAQEFSGVFQPRKVMESFLLTAMGPVGVVRGVAVLADPAACEGMVLSRGLPEAEAKALEGRLPEICDAFFPYRDNDGGLAPPRIRMVRRGPSPGEGPLPGDMDLLLCFSAGESHCGLLALGPLLGGGAPDGDVEELLHSLTHLLIGALRSAQAVSGIRQLGVDLGRKNERLTEALAESQAAQRSLDRRMRQMAAINDLAGELAHRHQVPEILDSFLLTMLGAFSVKSGLVLVLDRESRRSEHRIRGARMAGLEDFPTADALVYTAFAATGARRVAPLTVEPVASPATALAHGGLPFAPSCAVYFVLDSGVQGLLALGEPLSGEPLGEEDAQGVRAQVAALLGYVQGARRLATITTLNEDLTARNQELTRTIAELTQAHETIDLLERARERVRTFLRTEGARSRRFSWLDCGMILLASMLLGFLFNLASPGGTPLVPEHFLRPPTRTVTVQEAYALSREEGAILVDARPQGFFEQRRISGAVNLTPGLFDMIYLMRFSQTPLSAPVIIYGANISRRWDEDVAARFVAREHERVLVLEDGLEGWLAQGYPVEP